MIIATAGHIDHGKTSLVKALTGIDTDRLPEEKARGITIDLGFARYALADGTTATFVDVPGHERFVRTMIAGVAGVDCALIVVAADDGVMPQTVEHLEVLDLLGVTRGVVAVTKIDKVDEARIRTVERDIAARIARTRMDPPPIIPVSSVSGSGIEALRAALGRMLATSKARVSGGFRMTIDRAFTPRGAGLVVTGVVWSGRIGIGDRAILSPLGSELRIRGVQRNGAAASCAEAGARFALNVSGPGLHKEEFRRGAWIVAPELHAPTSILDVEIDLAAAGKAKPLRREQSVLLHLGSEHVIGCLRPIGRFHDDVPARFCHLTLDRPIGALYGDRFVLRDAGNTSTLAGGRVVDPFAPGRRWESAFRESLLVAMRDKDHAGALRTLSAQTPVDLARFFQSRNIPAGEQTHVESAVPLQHCGKGATRLSIGIALWQQLRDEAVRAVSLHERTKQDAPGAPIAVVQRALKPNDRPDIVDHVLAALVTEGRLVRAGRHVRLASSRPDLSSGELRRWFQAERLLSAAGLRPPHVGELAVQLNWDIEATQRLLKRAEQAGLVACVSRNRYFLPETLRTLARVAATLAQESEDHSFTAAIFKDRSGIGRNTSIDLLEFFDRVRLTQRLGARRRMRADVEAVFPVSPHEHIGECHEARVVA